MDNKNFYVYGTLEAIQRFLARKKIPCHQGVVLAVSGGLDSTVMAHAFVKLGIKPVVLAHCNFRLRSEESDGDESFVKSLGERLNVSVYIKSFDTDTFAAEKKLSIQAAARLLRYNWLDALRSELAFECIATAHHADDNAETVMQHIIDGTGLAGLRGIPPVNERIIRPLLSLPKNNLVEYAAANTLEFRTDSSNLKTDYTRNKIRHHVMPLLKELNPSISETLNANSHRWNDAYHVYQHSVERLKRKLLKPHRDYFTINLASLRAHNFAPTLLYETLKEFAFNSDQVEEIWNCREHESGKLFYSTTHRVIKDRTQLIVTEKEATSFHQVVKKGNGTFILPSGKLVFDLIPNSREINFDNARYQYLDADKLVFPLSLRPWKKGDYLYPFGLNKKKKVSDLFTDKKLSLLQKEKQPLLQSSEHVVALPGMTIDYRFRVTASTKSVLKIFYNKEAKSEHR